MTVSLISSRGETFKVSNLVIVSLLTNVNVGVSKTVVHGVNSNL